MRTRASSRCSPATSACSRLWFPLRQTLRGLRNSFGPTRPATPATPSVTPFHHSTFASGWLPIRAIPVYHQSISPTPKNVTGKRVVEDSTATSVGCLLVRARMSFAADAGVDTTNASRESWKSPPARTCLRLEPGPVNKPSPSSPRNSLPSPAYCSIAIHMATVAASAGRKASPP